MRRKKILLPKKVFIPVLIALVTGGALFFSINRGSKQPVQVQSSTDVVEEVVQQQPETPAPVQETLPAVVEKKPETAKWPVTYSHEEAASLTVVVNKKHKLPSDYAPSLKAVAGGQLRPEAATALSSLLNAADAAGVGMRIISSYRSYATQVSTYQKWVNQDGKAQADRSSARAGHSEHQTGLAVDLGMPDGSCDLEICFGTTAQGKWLAANAASYGFIIRYKSDTESVTGYQYEPWHLRYLGTESAQAVESSGKTLDQYFGVEAGGY